MEMIRKDCRYLQWGGRQGSWELTLLGLCKFGVGSWLLTSPSQNGEAGGLSPEEDALLWGSSSKTWRRGWWGSFRGLGLGQCESVMASSGRGERCIQAFSNFTSSPFSSATRAGLSSGWECPLMLHFPADSALWPPGFMGVGGLSSLTPVASSVSPLQSTLC